MNIHEYQAKTLLKGFGLPVLEGRVARSPDEALTAARTLPGPVYVVKSQIHAGGRGAGRFAGDPDGKGGVRLVRSAEEAEQAATAMLNHVLITKQTGPAGKQVNRLYIEAGCDIKRELYFSMLTDRESGRIAIIALAGRRHGDRRGRPRQPGEDPQRDDRPRPWATPTSSPVTSPPASA